MLNSIKIVEDRMEDACEVQRLRKESGLDINVVTWEAKKEYAKVFVRRLSDHICKDLSEFEPLAPNLDKLTTSSIVRLEEGLKVYLLYCDYMVRRETELTRVAVEFTTENDQEIKRTLKACKAELDASAKEYRKAKNELAKTLVYVCAFEEANLICEAVQEIFMTSGLKGEVEAKTEIYDMPMADLMKKAKIYDTIETMAEKQISIDRRMESQDENKFDTCLHDLPKDYAL